MFDLSKRPDVKIGVDMHDFCETSSLVKVPLASIRCVDETESAGSGFLTSSQRPKILFEGHYFYRFMAKQGLAQRASAIDPTVCYAKWTIAHYRGREGEYARIASATQICQQLGVSDALALRSASWGRYQIMGDNFHNAGYETVESFVEDMFRDEGLHLKSFGEYIVNAFLDDELRNLAANPLKYAALFALHYNGAGYRRNRYDIKIATSFKKFNAQVIDCAKILADDGHVIAFMPGDRDAAPSLEGFANTSLDERHVPRLLKLGMEGDDVRAAQEQLVKLAWLGADNVTGVFDQPTHDGLAAFQAANDLDADGKLGDLTYRKLFWEV